MTGIVILLSDPTGEMSGMTLAHELGHFLGLYHAVDKALCTDLLDEFGGWLDPSSEEACYNLQLPEYTDRLMFPQTTDGTNIIMTEGEANIMRGHCSTSGGC
jgi:hypothetical protein